MDKFAHVLCLIMQQDKTALHLIVSSSGNTVGGWLEDQYYTDLDVKRLFIRSFATIGMLGYSLENSCNMEKIGAIQHIMIDSYIQIYLYNYI
jgi:hypothetical protein